MQRSVRERAVFVCVCPNEFTFYGNNWQHPDFTPGLALHETVHIWQSQAGVTNFTHQHELESYQHQRRADPTFRLSEGYQADNSRVPTDAEIMNMLENHHLYSG